jgi:hypothetical protein
MLAADRSVSIVARFSGFCASGAIKKAHLNQRHEEPDDRHDEHTPRHDPLSWLERSREANRAEDGESQRHENQ